MSSCVLLGASSSRASALTRNLAPIKWRFTVLPIQDRASVTGTSVKFASKTIVTCSAKKQNDVSAIQVSVPIRPVGRNRPLSPEFLSVSGALSTVIAIAVLLPVITGHVSVSFFSGTFAKAVCVTLSSFAYGLLLSRFDLKKASALKLTIAFSLMMRFICIPILSHTVAIAGYTLVKLTGSKTAATAAAKAAATKAPATVKATAASLSLPAGVLSSLFLLSTAPVGYSPSAAMLSLHIHTTLLAILTVLTLILFPVVPIVSHIVSLWAHRSAFLNIGAILPKVAPPPSFPLLFLTTTLPVLLGLGVSRLLKPRWAAILGLFALPVAWSGSLILLASSVGEVVGGSITGFAGSVGLCGGVVLMMVLLGRALGSALLLNVRTKRTLILYLCTQGTIVGVGIAPNGFPAAPLVASALVGLAFAMIMGRAWSHVMIRTSTDVIL